MDTPTPEQLAKLPKWAQERIKHLETLLHINERTMRQFQDEQTISTVYFEDQIYNTQKSGPNSVKKYIQATGVSFVIDASKHHEIRVSHRYDSPGVLDISGGWGVLKIMPTASNCIRVACER